MKKCCSSIIILVLVVLLCTFPVCALNISLDAEEDTITGFTVSEDYTVSKYELEARSGKTSYLVQLKDKQARIAPGIVFTPQNTEGTKKYLASVYMKLPNDSQNESFSSTRILTDPPAPQMSSNTDTINKTDWTKFTAVFESSDVAPTAIIPTVQMMLPSKPDRRYLIDDISVEELQLKEFSISGDSTVQIDSANQYDYIARNQDGTEQGLEDILVEWSIVEPKDGISIDQNGVLTVADRVSNNTKVKIQAQVVDGEIRYGNSGLCTFDVVVKNTQRPVRTSLNFDFEDGNMAGWSKGEIVEGQGVDGSHALLVSCDTTNPMSSAALYPATLEPNRKYVVSMKFKLPDDSKNEEIGEGVIYPINSNTGEADYKSGSVITKTGWTEIQIMFKRLTDGASRPTELEPVFWGFSGTSDGRFLIDDVIVEEQFVKEISISGGADTLEIPENFGETSETTFYISAKNQLGRSDWFDGNELVLELADEYEGVSIDSSGKLTVTAEAKAGEIGLIARSVNHYEGDTDNVSCIKIVELISNNPLPRAQNVTINGDVAGGNTLHASYQYIHTLGLEEGDSKYQWYYAEDEFSTYQKIENATSKELLLTEELSEKIILFEVIPVDKNGVLGLAVRSEPVSKLRAPVAKNVNIIREKTSDGKIYLLGDYDYYQLNNYSEGESIYRWYRVDGSSESLIQNAKDKTLYLNESDVGKGFKFEVEPVCKDYDIQAESFSSETIVALSKPEAREVGFTGTLKPGNLLVGSYEYFHPFGDTEGKSIFEWTVDGTVVSEKIEYVISSVDVGKKIAFSVTPMSTVMPYQGDKITSSSKTIAEKSTGGSSGGGGGGGGFIISNNSQQSSFPSIAVVPDKEEQYRPVIPPEQRVYTDIENHWAQKDIEQMIVDGDLWWITDQTLLPDADITRAEFATLICSALDINPQDYTGVFSDIAEDHPYANYIEAIFNNWIMSGADGMFLPDKPIIREEVAKVVSSSALFLNQNVSFERIEL